MVCRPWLFMLSVFFFLCPSESRRQREEAGSPPFPFWRHVKDQSCITEEHTPHSLPPPPLLRQPLRHTFTHRDPESLQGPINGYFCALKSFFLSFFFQGLRQIWSMYFAFDLVSPMLEARELRRHPARDYCPDISSQFSGLTQQRWLESGFKRNSKPTACLLLFNFYFNKTLTEG